MRAVNLGELEAGRRFVLSESCTCAGFVTQAYSDAAPLRVTINRYCDKHQDLSRFTDRIASRHMTVLVSDFMDAMDRIEA